MTTLPNGLRVLLFERHDFPVVAARLVVARGAVDLGDAGGVQVTETEYIYGRGGSEAAFEALSREAGRTGTSYASGQNGSMLWFATRSPAGELDTALGILSRTTFRAELAPEEYGRRAFEWNASSTKTGLSLQTAEQRVLFGHSLPYGCPVPAPEAIPLQTAKTVRERLLQPSHSFLVVVGDVAPDALRGSAARAFGAWTATQTVPKIVDPPPTSDGPRLSILSQRRVAQTYGAVFARAPLAASEDFAPFLVVSVLLGGGKSSKLFEQQREESGNAYDPSAFIFVERTASWISLTAAYDAEKVVDGIATLLAAVKRLRSGEVTDDEIAVARETYLARHRESMATASGAAADYGEWLGLGLEPVHDRAIALQLGRVSREDIARVAGRYLGEESLHVALLGEERWLDARPLGMGAPVKLALRQ
jgi:zinc protease